jgi:hypothetical protein
MGSMIAFNNGATLDDIIKGIDWTIADPNMLILGWSSLMCGEDLVDPIRKVVVESLESRGSLGYGG